MKKTVPLVQLYVDALKFREIRDKIPWYAQTEGEQKGYEIPPIDFFKEDGYVLFEERNTRKDTLAPIIRWLKKYQVPYVQRIFSAERTMRETSFLLETLYARKNNQQSLGDILRQKALNAFLPPAGYR